MCQLTSANEMLPTASVLMNNVTQRRPCFIIEDCDSCPKYDCCGKLYFYVAIAWIAVFMALFGWITVVVQAVVWDIPHGYCVFEHLCDSSMSPPPSHDAVTASDPPPPSYDLAVEATQPPSALYPECPHLCTSRFV